MEKEKLNTQELVERFGNDKQKGYYQRNGNLAQSAEKSILKTLKQQYGFVAKTREGKRKYYIIGAKRDKEIERERARKHKDSFYTQNVVYMATNKVNGMRYVGSTSQMLIDRMAKHKNAAFDENSNNYNTKICAAIREFGFDSFEWQVLEVVEDKKDLTRIECYWIYHLQTNVDGYNADLGKWIAKTNKGDK